MKRGIFAMKKLVLLSILFLAILQISVHAKELPVTISYVTLNDQIPPNGAAKFTIFVTNNQDFDDNFYIEVPDVEWNAQTYPLPYFTNGFLVAPSTQKDFKLELAPIRTIPFGRHHVQVDFISKVAKQKYSAVFGVDVREDLIVYPVDIAASISMPAEIQPSNPFSLRVNLQNNQPVNIEGLVVKIESKLFSKEATVDISRNTDKLVEFTFNIDQMTPPQEDAVTATITLNGTEVTNATADYQVVSYLPPFKLKTDAISNWLVYTDIITVTNDGNVEKEQEVKIPRKFFDSMLAVPNPKAYKSDLNGKAAFTWLIKLAPGQSTTVTINRNYWSVLFSILVIIIALIIYFIFRSPIVVEKEARKVFRHGETLTGMKVMLRIKNRGLKPIHNVRIVDRIPAVANFMKETGDTARPSKVLNHKDEIFVSWDLAEVLPRGERIITYEARAKLRIVGGVDLKPATAQFKLPDGKVRHVKSNSLDIYL